MESVTFLNPRTCGIYKNGAPRYKTDPVSGKRTSEIDNELIDAVDAYLAGEASEAAVALPVTEVLQKRVLVPTYYDDRHNHAIRAFLAARGVEGVSIGELLDEGIISVKGGHGSPGNDQRTGHIPYVKVSDIRGLRINVNPTNLVSGSVARRFWRGKESGLRAWDLLTPNRASSNIGEFAILLPGEEEVVLTKEIFVFRIVRSEVWDPFYLLWCLSLTAVRDQWRRITLMQTNREDCGKRFREIVLPKPPDREWSLERSEAFRTYFESLALSKEEFVRSVSSDGMEYVANVASIDSLVVEPEEEPNCDQTVDE